MAGNSNLRRPRARNVAAGLVSLSVLIWAGQTQTPALAPPAAQDTQPQATASKNSPEMATRDTRPTFTSRTNLVLVRVVVRDRDGHVNGNLQKEDFLLFDKGKPQFISRFSLEKTTERKAEAEASEAARRDSAGGKSTAEQAIPGRYVGYLFDDVHLSIGDLTQARNAADRHLSDLPVSSRAAIYTTSGQVTQDFTDDVAKLRDALRRIQPRSLITHGTDCPELTYYQADLIQNKNDQQALQAATQDAIVCGNLTSDSTAPARGPSTAVLGSSTSSQGQSMAQAAASRLIALGDQETRLNLSVLNSLVRRLWAMPGQRAVVLISPGFLLLNQQWDETDIMDRAIRSNVTINTLNARGLYTLVPGGDASQFGGNAATMTTRTQYQRDSAMQEGDVLAELADGTGGTWFHDNNDLEEGFKRTAAAPEYYYLLGFSPENLKFDGSYHSLKVSLKKPAGLTLQARRGYYAPKHEVDAAQEAKREIEEALFSRDEWRDIPVELHTQFFKSSDVNAKLSVLARIDVRQLRFRKADGRNADILTVASGLFDRNGNYVTGMEKTVDMHLKDETLAVKLNSGITVRSGFDVAPGSYFVRIVVRDAEGQKMAALNGAVEIP
jgi:VWFA-related protein